VSVQDAGGDGVSVREVSKDEVSVTFWGLIFSIGASEDRNSRRETFQVSRNNFFVVHIV